MAPRQPKHSGLHPAVIDPANAVVKVKSRKHLGDIDRAKTARAKTIETEHIAVHPPGRTVRPRGSEFGQYADLDGLGIGGPEGENWQGADGRIPQIDPTPSSNPPRPRTLRAGYIRGNLPGGRKTPTGTLWVIFRDGTPWEYEDVPPEVWKNFRRVQSPGRYINRVLNQYPYHRGAF